MKRIKMKNQLKVHFLIIFILLFVNEIYSYNVNLVLPGSKVDVIPFPKGSSPQLEIFCYKGRPKYIINLWQTVILKIHSTSNDFELYEGNTTDQVISEYEKHHSTWTYNIFSVKSKSVKLNPFVSSCVGVEASLPYAVELVLLRIDYWKLILLISGIVLFWTAAKLCENSLFYYICGISFGITASFLILIYFVSKLFPRKPLMYGFMIGGWTIGVYVIQLLSENFRMIVEMYQTYLIYYIVGSGLLSFVICYRLGPPTNQRSKNLIRWCLMFISLVMIYNSSHYEEAVFGIMIMLIISYNFPSVWIAKTKTYWKRKFPPKTRLLTNEEYYQQGVKETCKALDELRVYCSSPKCNQWKTVLKLKDAKRFASFIEGSSHLSDDEILEYENEQVISGNEYLDDEDESIVDLTDDSSSSIEGN